MKKTLTLLAIVCVATTLCSQEKFSFGKCPVELLQMASYDKDPSASALVVYEDSYSRYSINGVTGFFQIVTDYVVRIKIFTQEGVSFSEAAIPLRRGETTVSEEVIGGLTGNTYNLEDGKVVKAKLSKDYVFTEEYSDYIQLIKFAMPAVKAGSVVEYKYRITSPYYYNPNAFVFQRKIPVKYSHFSITIPEYYRFSKESRGYEEIKFTSKPVKETYRIGPSELSCLAEEINAEVNDMPALKDDDFTWNLDDFTSQICFEINSIAIPGVYYKDFSNSWAKVVEGLSDFQKFGKQFNNKGILKDELPFALIGKENEIDSIRAILNLVRSKVKWNEKSHLYVTNQSKALKDGVGTSGDINAILINALRNAGFTAYPVAMSLRSRGKLPFTHPSSDDLNYFIACVYYGKNTYFLDGTLPYTDINVIPVNCMVDKALVIKNNAFEWKDLTNIGKNLDFTKLSLKFNEEGHLTGNLIENYSGENVFVFVRTYNKADNEQKFIEKIETENDIKISNYKTEVKTAETLYLIEQYEFIQNNINLDDEVISFNPLIFLAMKNNVFKPETRKLPIEFSYPSEDGFDINIEIPEGYVIDEIPTSEQFNYGSKGDISFNYNIQQEGNVISLTCTMNLRTCVVSATNYKGLRNFWMKMFNKQNEMITIKKK
jgi:hypothetical protein